MFDYEIEEERAYAYTEEGEVIDIETEVVDCRD